MYHDDVELGWKAKLAGYRIVLAPRSVMYHKYEFSRSIRMLYYMERNRYLVMLTLYRLPTLLAVAPAMIAMEIGMYFYSIAGGWLGTKLRVSGYFLNPVNWLKIYHKRHFINGIRRKKDREIVWGFSGQVLFQEIENPVLKYIANPVFNAYWQIVKKLIWW